MIEKLQKYVDSLTEPSKFQTKISDIIDEVTVIPCHVSRCNQTTEVSADGMTGVLRKAPHAPAKITIEVDGLRVELMVVHEFTR